MTDRGKAKRVRSLLWRALETRAWASFAHVICISPYVRERLSGVSKGRLYDIDNPVGGCFFDTPQQRSKRGILCAAFIGRRKNQHVLVESIGILARRGVDVSLRLAGELCDERYLAEVRSRIDHHQLDGRVVLMGVVSTGQIVEEFASAQAFALVSLEENSPMGIEEAMAAGVPVVTSNRCGMPYMIRDGESGYLVDPHDPVEIADRLQRILEDDALRQSMGEKGRQTALERYHPDIVARRTREVYYRAVEGAKRGRP
jgi:glycosyltransferase involved in cell wall biosynthesis